MHDTLSATVLKTVVPKTILKCASPRGRQRGVGREMVGCVFGGEDTSEGIMSKHLCLNFNNK